MNKIRLKEISSKIGSGATPRGGKNSYKSEGISLIRSMNVYDSAFEYTELAFIDEQQAKELSNVQVERSDILLNITGASVARCCMVPNNLLPARVNQHVAIIRIKKELANPRHILYCLISHRYKQKLLAIAQGGATREALTKEKIEDFEILLPSLSSQHKIASILSAYDHLIENNLKRIKILEEMAQMIYREWFVNFRFPGHEKVKMVKSELGMIPEGWEVKKLGEMLEFQKGKKAKNIYHQPLNNSIPYLLIDGLRNRSFLYADDKTMPIAKRDDILMVMDGASSGQVFIGFEGAVGSTIGTYRIKDTNNLFSYLVYFFLKNNFKTISEKNIGSAIPHANKDFIASMKIVTPKSNIVILFSDFASDIYKQIDVLERKTLNLRKTRNLLLPKLISGEVDVDKLNIQLNNKAT